MQHKSLKPRILCGALEKPDGMPLKSSLYNILSVISLSNATDGYFVVHPKWCSLCLNDTLRKLVVELPLVLLVAVMLVYCFIWHSASSEQHALWKITLCDQPWVVDEQDTYWQGEGWHQCLQCCRAFGLLSIISEAPDASMPVKAPLTLKLCVHKYNFGIFQLSSSLHADFADLYSAFKLGIQNLSQLGRAKNVPNLF